jgi:hypothetical protein
VKVIGGFEIYNFRIQHLVHFCTRFWRDLISNRGPAKRFGPGRRRAPADLGVRAACRPRLPAGRGSLFPICRVPRPLESYRRARATDRAVPARCVPRTAGPSAAPRRTRAGRGRLPRPHLRGHTAVTPAEPPL